MTPHRASRPGFTLIEVLAVVALIGLVFYVALNFYTDVSRATHRALEKTHEARRAAAILDRVARDFERTVLLVKPPALDPLAHPWLFIGESHLGGPGADHIKFVTRNHDPTRTESHESDLAMVAYTVDTDEDDRISLYRWSTPHLPDELDPSYPSPLDEGSFLVAEDLGSFGIQFLGGGDSKGSDEWDSTTLLQSSTLPTAVVIELSMLNPNGLENDETTLLSYRRKVPLPVAPLDLTAMIAVASTGGEGTGNEDDDKEDDDEDDNYEEDDYEEDGSDSRSASGGPSARDSRESSGKCAISVSFVPGCSIASDLISALPSQGLKLTGELWQLLTAEMQSCAVTECRP